LEFESSQNDLHHRNCMKSLILCIAFLSLFSRPSLAEPAPPSRQGIDHPFFPFCIDWSDSKKRTFAQQAQMLKVLGYDGVGHIWLDNVAERLKTLDEAGLKLFQITMTVDITPGKPAYDARFTNVLSLVNGRHVQFCLLINGAKPSDASADARGVEVLREMSELARDSGSQLLLYPHVGCWVERIQDSVRVANEVDRPNVGAMFNLCHWLRVDKSRDYKPLLQAALPRLWAVSINGADVSDDQPGWNRYIQPLDAGSFDMCAFLKVLGELGYRGPVGLQCFGIGGDAREHLARSMAAWQKLKPCLEDAPSNAPVTINASADWIPLKPELEIQPGSALDFSGLRTTDEPAGKHGRVIAGPDAQFAFADSPKQPRRFYGVNFCFSSLYLSHDESDRLADRLARLGYNALRIHHYERELTRDEPKSTVLNPDTLDQLDYFVAALIRRGIYLTTDLFVSRGIRYRDIGLARDGEIPMDTYKILVPVHEGAFENWKQFARAFLGHTNPYTHRRYADEPALAWIALINEGNFGNFFKDLKTFPEWKEAWNHWLARRYPSRERLASAWGIELKDKEDPAANNVELPDIIYGKGLRVRDCVAFLGDTDREMVGRMKTLLRNELGCHALVSNSSSWTRFTTDQRSRETYDYVDDHFYVDHPKFLESPWRLPSRCPNTSPIAEGAPGGCGLSFTRLFDKPFTVTEFNYAGPGRFRGVGGILTGALGALQGWGGIWRFDYSGSRDSLLNPAPMGYFDLACDPLSQAGDRASLCLFLRGDLQTAPHSVALTMTEADLAHPAARIPTLAPNWNWLAWVTRVGTEVLPSPRKSILCTAIVPLAWETPASAYDPKKVVQLAAYAVSNDQLIGALRDKHWLGPDAGLDPAQKFFRSETGEITIDGPRGCLILDTPRTAGGYAPAGQSLTTGKGGVEITVEGSDATVWVSALDSKPIRQSHHLLVTHLTDLQNSGIRYGESARQTLLAWGHLPYLVHAGQAEITIEHPSSGRVWALSPGGRRMAEIPCRTDAQGLRFTADVAGAPDEGARMLYEVAF